MNDTGIVSYMKNSPKKVLIAALGALGVILLICGAFMPSSDGGGESTPEASASDYARELEARITAICEKVAGVSDVSVLLTLDGGSERVFAENKSDAGDSYVVVSVDGEERTVLVREIYSSVRGIAVVCRGGGDAATKRTISELLSCALGVPISKISVAGAGK